MRNVKRSAFSGGVVLLLLLLSIVLGYISDQALGYLDRIRYPKPFSEEISYYSDQYELDEHIVYAMIRELSDFSSNRVSDDGRIGLMQLSRETFLWLTEEHFAEDLDAGMLYEPETNIRYGCCYLLYLTTRYDSWEMVYAAYLCGPETVDTWLSDASEGEFDEDIIRDQGVRKRVDKIQRAVDKYKKLYA